MIDEIPFLALEKAKRRQEAGRQKLLFDVILGMLTKYPLKPVLRSPDFFGNRGDTH